MKLARCYQRKDENPTEYMYRVLDLCKQVDRNMPEREQLRYILVGLKNRFREQLAASGENRDLMSCKSALRRLGAASQQFNPEEQMPQRENRPDVERNSANRNERNNNVQRNFNAVCYNCNGNHLLKDCRKPKDQARIEANRKILANMRRGNINHEEPNMVNAIQSSEIKSSEIQEVLAPDFDCFQLNVLLPPMGRATKQEGDDASCPIPFKGNCYIPQNFTFIGSTIYESIRERAVPVIKMKVNGVETKALIDSGSAISVISETLFNKLRTPFYAWFGGLLRGADGKGIKPQGITKIIVSHEKGT
ncbi:hypothetical protein B4U79_17025, partial [Dinothrombium tinctorium]